jgi:hypothetical protein
MFFIHAANDYSTNSGKALDAELARLGKPHRLEIYPPVGQTPDDGHDFPNNSVAAWEPDVFAFLDPYMRNQSHEKSAMVTARATRHRQR